MITEAWIARDKDGRLEIFTTYPQKNRKENFWVGEMLLDDNDKHNFPDIDWNDDFAKHVEITINELPQ